LRQPHELISDCLSVGLLLKGCLIDPNPYVKAVAEEL
jgi:hypothetical protein